jgi:exonuclease III
MAAKIKVVTWNMRRYSQPWQYLWQDIQPDIALLQEAIPPSDHAGVEFSHFRFLQGSGFTLGGLTAYYGTGLVAKDKTMKAIEIEGDHPGALAAGRFRLPDKRKLTFVSLYGFTDLDGFATTTAHRLLSDLTPLLSGRDPGLFILGGDLAVSPQFDEYTTRKRPSHQLVFDRIADFGLVNCLAKFHPEPVQTIRHHRIGIPWQTDYLFASAALLPNLISCEVLNSSEIDLLSDHSPIVAEFEF